MPDTRRNRKYFFLAMLFFLLLSFPVLSLFSRQSSWNHIPSIVWYVFAAWMLLIGTAFLLQGLRTSKRNKHE
jgi:phosphoglycerol transferase MdoB-like AlkP superfamily enzyme